VVVLFLRKMKPSPNFGSARKAGTVLHIRINIVWLLVPATRQENSWGDVAKYWEIQKRNRPWYKRWGSIYFLFYKLKPLVSVDVSTGTIVSTSKHDNVWKHVPTVLLSAWDQSYVSENRPRIQLVTFNFLKITLTIFENFQTSKTVGCCPEPCMTVKGFESFESDGTCFAACRYENWNNLKPIFNYP